MVGVAMLLEPIAVLELPEEPIPLLFELEGAVVDGVLMGAGVTGGVMVSSVFLLQAPSANRAATATAVAKTGLNFDTDMRFSFSN